MEKFFENLPTSDDFFSLRPRNILTSRGLRHILIVETGFPLQIHSIRRFLMNNCLCNVFDNNNWIWIILIVLLFLCCGGGCGC